ncbi:hypothetical protein [Muriicola soli]|uniref:Uncharacterized protein n=1 Tax=Muriicola soli TaxID=2507538 RepID=A0A411E606_9FLAO|nr:hypothetical protein [Muriicola soli]QBA63136.1 hypothetical protein EQY75_00310 [Muriicola soli]
MKFHTLLSLSFAFILLSCSSSEEDEVIEDTSIKFGSPQRVTVQGYDDQIMEPFLSRDGSILFFNNWNNPSVDTNLHWSTRINNTLFEYQGELQGVATEDLEGVPTMDQNNTLYYVYTGDYFQTLQSIYKGTYEDGVLSNISVVENLSLNEPGWLNFDVEVANDGQTLYFVDGLYDENGGPREANFSIARKSGTEFQRDPNSATILANINTEDLEYAAAISKNELELSFTRIIGDISPDSEARIYIATRTSTDLPFSVPQLITEITGFVEGPTFSADDNGLYYHKKENEDFVLYYIEKQP